MYECTRLCCYVLLCDLTEHAGGKLALFCTSDHEQIHQLERGKDHMTRYNEHMIISHMISALAMKIPIQFNSKQMCYKSKIAILKRKASIYKWSSGVGIYPYCHSNWFLALLLKVDMMSSAIVSALALRRLYRSYAVSPRENPHIKVRGDPPIMVTTYKD